MQFDTTSTKGEALAKLLAIGRAAPEDREVTVVGAASANQVIALRFPIPSAGDISVSTKVTASGAVADLALTTGFTVSVAADGMSGSVTVIDAVAATSTITVKQKVRPNRIDAGAALSAVTAKVYQYLALGW